MNHNLTDEKLVEYFSVSAEEHSFIKNKSETNRLLLLSFLKYYHYNGKFPSSQFSVPKCVIKYLAEQIAVSISTFYTGKWAPRTLKRYRTLVREYLDFSKWKEEYKEKFTEWLLSDIISDYSSLNRIKDLSYKYLQEHKIEPPSPGSLERIILSALSFWEENTLKNITAKLSDTAREKIDNLFIVKKEPIIDKKNEAEEDDCSFRTLKKSPGSISSITILKELNKLRIIKSIGLDYHLFETITPYFLKKYRDRIITEPAREVRRHPDYIKYGMVSVFLYVLNLESKDSVCDYLIHIIKGINKKSEKIVTKKLIKNLISLKEKDDIVLQVFTAAVENPDSTIREALFTIVGERTFQQIIDEYKKKPSYTKEHNISMKFSYGAHYRKMLPDLLEVIEFNTNNAAYQPILDAVTILKKYIDCKDQFFPENEHVPTEDAIHPDFKNFIYKKDKNGNKRINRVSYELGVLKVLTEKLSSKALWINHSDRYRNPDNDTPKDFDVKKTNYYQKLGLPEKVDDFIKKVQNEMDSCLTQLNDGIPSNSAVRILKKDNGWIQLTPYEKLPDPENLTWLKKEMIKQWNMVNLLDVFKDSDFRINFTRHFQSKAQRNILLPEILKKRLYLVLYAIGTNAGIYRIASGSNDEKYDDLIYVKRRYLSKEAVKNAITDVVNATLSARRPDIWGEATTTCASDSTQFGSWDQNLISEWHMRYGGRGVMIYWHVEKGSLCIYSQLKSCSSSEAAAMIEGVIRHCMEMQIEKQFVDTHGQSYVAFAFSYLLGFDLLPRFK